MCFYLLNVTVAVIHLQMSSSIRSAGASFPNLLCMKCSTTDAQNSSSHRSQTSANCASNFRHQNLATVLPGYLWRQTSSSSNCARPPTLCFSPLTGNRGKDFSTKQGVFQIQESWHQREATVHNREVRKLFRKRHDPTWCIKIAVIIKNFVSHLDNRQSPYTVKSECKRT